jgi:hypothetical protein
MRNTPSKPGSDFAKQYGAVERGNRNAQPPGKPGPGMTTSPRPQANPNRGMTTSPRPQANPKNKPTTPRGPSKPKNI